jgi:hypothetical protein
MPGEAVTHAGQGRSTITVPMRMSTSPARCYPWLCGGWLDHILLAISAGNVTPHCHIRGASASIAY